MEERNLNQELKETKIYYKNVRLELRQIVIDNAMIEKKHTEYIDENGQKVNTLEYGVYMNFKGENIKIATINDNGDFIPNTDLLQDEKYSQDDLDALGDMLNRLGLEQDKVDINKLEQQLQEREALTEEELEQETGEKGGEKEESIKDDDKNEEEKDEEKEKVAKKYNLSASQVVHIDMASEKITENETFAGLVKWADGKKDVYVIPGKDPYTWRIIGRDKDQTEYTEIEEANRQIYGKNPDITIKRIDGEKITKVQPIAVHDIDGKSVIAIVKNNYGEPEALYCRKQEGKQEYFGSVVPEVSGKNVRQMEYDERAFMSSKYNSAMDLDKKADELEEAENLHERGIPSKEEGVQVYEIEGNSTQNHEMRKEEIEEDLYKRKGISEKMKGAMPGYIDYMYKKIGEQADKILKLMKENQDMTYEQAVEITDKEGQREKGGETPGERRKRGF